MKMAGQNLVLFNPIGLYRNRARRFFAVTDRKTGWFKEWFCNGINTSLSIIFF